jgi:hypothetical protein
MQNGEVIADRVIENIKWREAVKEKKKSSGVKPRKKMARVEQFEIYQSNDEEEEKMAWQYW